MATFITRETEEIFLALPPPLSFFSFVLILVEMEGDFPLPNSCGNRIVAEYTRSNFPKGTPYTGPIEVVSVVQHQQCDTGIEPEETNELGENVPWP